MFSALPHLVNERDAGAIGLARAALAKAGSNGSPSLFVLEAGAGETLVSSSVEG